MRELSSGRVIRRQYKKRYVDEFPSLAAKIDNLLSMKHHEKVYAILCKLRDWEINPQDRAVFGNLGDKKLGDVQAYDYVDLTKQNEVVDLTAEKHSDFKDQGTCIKQERDVSEEKMSLHELQQSVSDA